MIYKAAVRALRGVRVCYLIFIVVSLATLGLIFASTRSHPGRTMISAGSSLDIGALFAIACFFAAITASSLALSLSSENDKHLPLVFTRPISRERFLTQTVGINFFALLTLTLAIVLTEVAIVAALGASTILRWTPDSASEIAKSLLFPICTYAVFLALTASLRRPVAVVVMSSAWAVFGTLVGMQAALVGTWLGGAMQVINVVNPLAYLSSVTDVHRDRTLTVHATTTVEGAIGMLVLALVAIAAAGWQWRRLEV